jgi:hypothetical protein
MSSTGNAIHGNIITTGLITATGNVIGGNIVTTGIMSSNSLIVTNNGANITGNTSVTGNVSVTGNITASYFLGNIIGNITGNVSGLGSNSQVIFNDNGTLNGSSNLTFTKTTNSLRLDGNLSSNGEASFWRSTYVDPDAGVPRAIKVGSSGIAVLGGIKTDSITATGNAILGNAVTANYFVGNVTGTITVTAPGTSSANVVYASMAGSDHFRILVGASASDAGYVEIATADNGNEPIYVRQYSGTFAAINKTATLLDSSGDTTFPGTVTATTFAGSGANLTSLPGANVTGTVANATYAATVGTVTTAAQPNITSVGTLTGLTVGPNSSITLSGTSGYLKANSIQGIDGTQAIYPYFGSVAGAVGIRTNLIVGAGGSGNLNVSNGSATFGDVSTVRISGGSSGYVLSTDGAGNLSWSASGGGGGGSGQAITIQDEGTVLTSNVASIDFTGSGVSATATGNVVTVNITSGNNPEYTVPVNTTSSNAVTITTSVPSWAKRITVLFNGLSTTGTSGIQVQVGSGSFDTTGYSSASSSGGSSVISVQYTTGFGVRVAAATNSVSGAMVMYNVSGNTWVTTHTMGSTSAASPAFFMGGGTKTLTGALDRIRVTTITGSETFDAGSVNVLYE